MFAPHDPHTRDLREQLRLYAKQTDGRATISGCKSIRERTLGTHWTKEAWEASDVIKCGYACATDCLRENGLGNIAEGGDMRFPAEFVRLSLNTTRAGAAPPRQGVRRGREGEEKETKK